MAKLGKNQLVWLYLNLTVFDLKLKKKNVLNQKVVQPSKKSHIGWDYYCINENKSEIWQPSSIHPAIHLLWVRDDFEVNTRNQISIQIF